MNESDFETGDRIEATGLNGTGCEVLKGARGTVDYVRNGNIGIRFDCLGWRIRNDGGTTFARFLLECGPAAVRFKKLIEENEWEDELELL